MTYEWIEDMMPYICKQKYINICFMVIFIR
jgi:hypothetical protein